MSVHRASARSTKRLRSQAEHLLATTPREVAQMAAEDVQKLVHELQVHQIELEMQNKELRRVQEELEAARERYADLFDFAPSAILTLETDGTIRTANLAAGSLLGLDRRDLIHKKFASFIPPGGQDDFYLFRRRVLASAQKLDCELGLVTAERQRLTAQLQGVAVNPLESRTGQWRLTLMDLTERKRTEEALREASEWNRQIIMGANEGIVVCDRELKYLTWNPYMEKLTGMPAAEVIGKDQVEVFPEMKAAGVLDHLREVLAGKPSAIREYTFPAPRTNRSRKVSVTQAPLRNAGGEITGVISIVTDITERKQMEDSLRRSEQTLSSFFDLSPVGLVWLSASGAILRANQAQLDLLDYPLGEYVGRFFNDFSVDPSHGRELLERLAANETVRNFRLVLRRKDGTSRHVLADANPFWSENEFRYSSVFVRDITDRIELEKEVLQISEQEHHRIAHDIHDGLGQLLAGTAYMTDTLQKNLAAKTLPEARQLRRILKVIYEAIAQTRNLARGLHPVEPVSNGLMAALKGLAARTKTMFRIQCRFSCRRPVYIKDNTVATHLYRIAQEAITNAIKHGKPGRIDIMLTATPERINLAIKDNGTGISARRSHKQGMGLRIMRYRMGMIGGSFAVQKEAGGGTSVVCSVHLPIRGVRESKVAAPARKN